MISGRLRSAAIRGARTRSIPFICSTSWAAVFSSKSGSEPVSMMDMSRPVPPPPLCDWKEIRASGIFCSSGSRPRSNSIEVFLRSSFNDTNTVALVSRTRVKARSTSGCAYINVDTRSAIFSVCSRVVPGTTSIWTRLLSSLMVGWNWAGVIANKITVRPKATRPTPIIHIRWSCPRARKRPER